MALRNTTLHLRIGEAKNLLAKDINGSSDPYCIVKVDNEITARSKTVYKSLEPFWGEEFYFHLPRGFQDLGIYVYDEDKLSGDDIIGTVSVTKDILSDNPKGSEAWFPLRKRDKDQEVQGEILVEYWQKKFETEPCEVYFKVIGARDLAPKDKSGSSDPYITVAFGDTTKTTTKLKKTRYPIWNEEFVFRYLDFLQPGNKPDCVIVTAWDWDRLTDDDYMGQVTISLSDIPLNSPTKQWYVLQKKSKDEEPDVESLKDRGSIRLKMKLLEEKILPSSYYEPLIDLFLRSVSEEVEPGRPTPLSMLEEVMTLDLIEIANTLVKLYLGQGTIVQYLDVICTKEIQETSDINTLFRGNSLATKSMDQFMKIVGMPYLHEVLADVIEKIYHDRKVVELDPSRVNSVKRRYQNASEKTTTHVLEESRTSIEKYLSLILEKIINSSSRCPPLMRTVFINMQQQVRHKWPDNEYRDHDYLAISGFLFLRFFAPAVLSPKLFYLQDSHPDRKVSRTLTLLAKLIQVIGNLAPQAGKEAWLEPVRDFLNHNVDQVKMFIDNLCDKHQITASLTSLYTPFSLKAVLKEGFLLKKRYQSKKLMKSFTMKQRYFWLTNDTLTYARKSDSQMFICRVMELCQRDIATSKVLCHAVRTTFSTSTIAAVENVEYSAFHKSKIGQIIMRTKDTENDILYIQAKDVNDLSSWLSAIRKTCITNDCRTDFYHPGVFKGNKWSCCHKVSYTDVGCDYAHCHVTIGDWRDPLDPDIEAQTIYSQLNQAEDYLRKKYTDTEESISESLKKASTNSDNIQRGRPSIAVKDKKLESVAMILDVIQELSIAHEEFKEREKSNELPTCEPV